MVADAVTASFPTSFGVRNSADYRFLHSHYFLYKETTLGFSSGFPKQLVAVGIGHVKLKSDRARNNGSINVNRASRRDVAHVQVTNHMNLDLRSLCRKGKVEAALELMKGIEKQGASVDPSNLISLMQACVDSKSLESGRRVHDHINKSLSRPSISVFNKLVEMYLKLGSSEDAHKVFEEIPERDLDSWNKMLLGDPKSPPSGLELSNKSKLKKHSIRKRKQQMDPKKVEAYEKLESLSKEMKEAGYVADTKYVLHDIDEEAKEKALMHHSERLAIAYGLISTPAGTTLRIMKNLRICGDCHNAIKIISKIEEREIIVRDNKRFHHFKSGKCSCGDYW